MMVAHLSRFFFWVLKKSVVIYYGFKKQIKLWSNVTSKEGKNDGSSGRMPNCFEK